MEELIEKLYNAYLVLLEELAIGHPLSKENLHEVWELIHLLDFITYGRPTETELLWIAGKYENAKASLLDVDFDDEF